MEIKKHQHKHSKSVHKHKPKSSRPKPKFDKPKYRWIEDLHNIHKEKEIWVLGTGWSLDEFPDDFFKDKITIAHRAASTAFPYCNYVWAGNTGTMIKKFLEFQGESGFKKVIVGLSGGRRPSQLKWLGTNSKDPIYMYRRPDRRSKEEFKDEVKKMAECIIKGEQYRPYVCYRTTIHFAVEAAIIMGASKVTLVGASHRVTKWKYRAQKRGILLIYSKNLPPPEGYPTHQPWCEHSNFGTNLLAQTFESYGILIRRYFYGKGYEQIPAPVEPKGES